MALECFEKITHRYGLEKIKTGGDAFMASAGLLSSHDNQGSGRGSLRSRHDRRRANLSSRLRGADRDRSRSVAAGIMGKWQFQYA